MSIKPIIDIDPVFIDNIINEVYKLKLDKGNDLDEIWNVITSKKIKQPVSTLKFEPMHRNLLEKVSERNKQMIVKYLCEGYQDFKEITGVGYFKAISELDGLVKKLEFKIDVKSYLKNKEVSPAIFINYVESAKGDFERYKLICDVEELNKYLINSLPDDLNFTIFFDQIKKTYDLNEFYIELKKKYSDSVTADNFYFLNYAYKSLSESKPLKNIPEINRVMSLRNTINNNKLLGYYDIEAIVIANNQPSSIHVNDEEEIKQIAERIEYYKPIGELLILSLSWNKANLNKILLQLLQNPVGQQNIEVEKILPRFNDIITKLGVEPTILLERLNVCFYPDNTSITKDNIQQIIPDYNFYSSSVEIKNALTKYIYEVAKQKLQDIDPETLFKQKDQPSYYWIAVANYLITGGVIRKLPDNLIVFGCKVLEQFAIDGVKPNNIVESIIHKIPASNITSTIKTIAIEFYNKRYIIDPVKFKYFEIHFRKGNRIDKEEGLFVRTILDVIVANKECLKLILENLEFYTKVVNKAGDEAENFKLRVKNLLQSQPSDELNEFAKLIGMDLNVVSDNEA